MYRSLCFHLSQNEIYLIWQKENPYHHAIKDSTRGENKVGDLKCQIILKVSFLFIEEVECRGPLRCPTAVNVTRSAILTRPVFDGATNKNMDFVVSH